MANVLLLRDHTSAEATTLSWALRKAGYEVKEEYNLVNARTFSVIVLSLPLLPLLGDQRATAAWVRYWKKFVPIIACVVAPTPAMEGELLAEGALVVLDTRDTEAIVLRVQELVGEMAPAS